jgi:hypothetical protein
MIYHVLPGDSLVKTFQETGIEGEVIVCREAFVAGDLDADDLDQLWDVRSNFVSVEYGGDPIEYQDHVASELEKLLNVTSEDEVNLWFEYELFCSVNMWFCLDLLKNSDANIFRVVPIETSPDDVWAGFGKYQADDLVKSFDAKVQFTQEDRTIGSKLWSAFRERDFDTIRGLSSYRSSCFPFLKEVCDAAAEIESEPIELIRELKASGLKDLDEVFPEFRKRAGVYGFGDSQVARLMNRV